jgi:TonB-dependent SusC/RagA subfamily outer membrane receptor
VYFALNILTNMKKKILILLSATIFTLSISAQGDNTNPLVVINGKASNIKPSSIEPSTVASIKVLKDEAATEAYGILGKNGVLIITTKDFEKIDFPKDQANGALILVNGEVYNTDMNSINPKEVKAITVLKDKSATDIYGVAGKNGVILVTTNDKVQDDS